MTNPDSNTRLSFSKAQRKQVKLKLAITGPSGSGKTYSALLLASGLGKKIALIDTENDSASLYSDKFDFDALNLTPPYTVNRYKEGIENAELAGYDVLIIDQISHAWSGEGGLLAEKEALDARGGNSYANWAKLTPKHEAFKSHILRAGLHVICTMRSKQDYVLEINNKGKQAPIKVGLAPIQRDGMEYEFTTVFDIAMDHNAQASKDRTGLFDGETFKIKKGTGEKLLKWLKGGVKIVPKENKEPLRKARYKLAQVAHNSSLKPEDMKKYLKESMGVESTKGMNLEQVNQLTMDIEDGKVMEFFTEQMFGEQANEEANHPQ